MKAVGRLKQTDFKLVSFSPPFEPLCYEALYFPFSKVSFQLPFLLCERPTQSDWGKHAR